MILNKLLRWLDNGVATPPHESVQAKQVDWLRVLPFFVLHVACFSVIWVGWSMFACLFALVLYVVRMFAITGFYHRYFSHKAFKTSRFMQCIFAIFGATAIQRGPLWWASHHRNHHINSENPQDAHSPIQHGFIWSHVGWFLSEQHFYTKLERVQELAKFPELRFLDRFDVIVPSIFGVLIYIFGEWLAESYPALHTNGLQLFVWGFVISTVVLYHATFTVNSLAHTWGSRRYGTNDQSRNNAFIAIITLGEGWHNNHHHFPGAARQGFYWWEIDLTYYGLQLLATLGLIWDLRAVPIEIREARRID